MTKPKPPSDRTRVRRGPAKGVYDRETIYRILDEALLCNVGFSDATGTHVIPMTHWRMGNRLYIHGSTASRMMRHLASGAEACLSTTLLDGLVLARSAFHHSMNYRSVMVYGVGKTVEDPGAKHEILDAFMDKLFPGRKSEARAPYAKELKGTLVLGFSLDEAAAKIRTGHPIDEPEDMELPVWSGVIPLRLEVQPPIQDPVQDSSLALPDYVKRSELMQFPRAWDHAKL